MANINLYRVSVPAGSYSKVDWTECDINPGPTQYLYDRFTSIDLQAVNNTVSASSAATIAIIGYCNDDCTGCYLIGETTTTSTTIPPPNFNISTTCEGTGINGTGKITIGSFSGGNGTYYSVGIGTSAGTAFSATPTLLSGATSYNFTNLTNGTYHIILRDSSGANTTKNINVSCTNTTTTTSTTTSTTTAAPICTFNGGSVGIVYSPTTTSTSTTSTTTSTSTTSTTTAAPTTTSTTTSTTTVAPTTTTTSTSTTTASPYNYYLADRYDCTNCTLSATNIVVKFDVPFNPNPLEWHRPVVANGFTYRAITPTTAASAVTLDTVGYSTCIAACAITSTTTSTSTTSTTLPPNNSFSTNVSTATNPNAITTICADTVRPITLYSGTTNTLVDGERYYNSDGYTPYNGAGGYYGNAIMVGIIDSNGYFTQIASCLITTTTTTTTLSPPTESINLNAQGDICGAQKDWTGGTVQEVKCDWLEVFDGTPSYSGIIMLYYTAAGINVGTQLYSSTAGNPPMNDGNGVGNFIYYVSYPPSTAKVITIANGIITAINNVSDLPACGTYNCP